MLAGQLCASLLDVDEALARAPIRFRAWLRVAGGARAER